MALYRCVGGNGSGPGPSAPSYEIELIENNTTNGSSTFTITEDGTYLIIASNSYSGSRSITLPQGRTATIQEDINVSGSSRGMTVVVADLQANDVVTMSATASTWTAFSKLIYKLSNVTVLSVDDTSATDDPTSSSVAFSVSSTGSYLVIGLCFGINETSFRDMTNVIAWNLSRPVGVNTIAKVYADTGANIPELRMYGYDGGGVYYISMNIS